MIDHASQQLHSKKTFEKMKIHFNQRLKGNIIHCNDGFVKISGFVK